jgi:serine protease Do
MFDPFRAKVKVAFYTAVAFLFGLGLASGLGWTGPSMAMPVISTGPQVSEEAVRPALDLSDAFVSISEAITPAVVRIETSRTRMVSTRNRMPEEFRRFFDMPQQDPNQPRIQTTGGSGFIISADGYILTNNHVVEDADEIRVYLQDGRFFTAITVGTDPTTDVAVIKVDADGLPLLSFGSSDETRVGEWILAVGNPGMGTGPPDQLAYTVTAGIISAKGRPLNLIRNELRNDPDFDPANANFAIEDFIQTDAVINPGNSGGPMVNLRGEVVGINSAIYSQSGYYQGYGFAIPIDLARRVMEDLIQFGEVRRAWLGVSINDVAPEDAEFYELPSVTGVLVQEVTEGGPAEGAGLQQGDVIVSLDGMSVGTGNQLQRRVAQKRPGETTTVRIYRDGEPRDVRVRLGEAPFTERAQPEPEPEPQAEQKLGIQFDELTPELARRIGYDEPGGVVITGIQPGGPASRRNVPPGWKILSINDQPVLEPDDVNEILSAAAPGDIVSLLLEGPDGATAIRNLRAGR